MLDVVRGDDLSFRYEPAWLERTQLPHHPLSLALPLSPDPYDHDRAWPFFDGLLPEFEQTRDALARYLQVDATDDYSLLYQLGRDCPGAVTVMPLDDEGIDDENSRRNGTCWTMIGLPNTSRPCRSGRCSPPPTGSCGRPLPAFITRLVSALSIAGSRCPEGAPRARTF